MDGQLAPSSPEPAAPSDGRPCLRNRDSPGVLEGSCLCIARKCRLRQGHEHNGVRVETVRSSEPRDALPERLSVFHKPLRCYTQGLEQAPPHGPMKGPYSECVHQRLCWHQIIELVEAFRLVRAAAPQHPHRDAVHIQFFRIPINTREGYFPRYCRAT